MDFDTKKIIDDLEAQAHKNHPTLRMDMLPYTVEWRAMKKLKEFSIKIEKLEHELLIEKSQADAWNKALVDQLKENVALKAQLLNDEVNYDLEKINQKLKGTIKNHEDRILELEKEVEYHKAFANSGKIKELENLAKANKERILELVSDNQNQNGLIKLYEATNADMAEKIKKLELDIKYLEDKNRFISDLNDAYRKMVLKDQSDE